MAYAEACGADAYRVETLDEFNAALDAALASGRPTLIDAAITRLALPHYSGSPGGRLARIVERVKRWLGGRPYAGILTGLFDGISDRVGNPRMPGVFARLWDHIRRWLTR